jgi:hypothetical protein
MEQAMAERHQSVSERLACLWNGRHDLDKAEWLEFYDLVTRQVWVRANIRSLCHALLLEPRDALHDCFVEKVLTPARGGRRAKRTPIEPEAIVGYLTLMLHRYLIDQLRRQDVDRGGRQVINLGDEQWASLLERGLASSTEPEVPALSTRFVRWLRQQALPAARDFVRQLDREELVLLKCWYAGQPRPPLSWFGRLMPNPDYRARRLGINPCRREYVDFRRTRIGKWADHLGVSLARNRYPEIHAVLEMLRVLASREQEVDCAALDIGPPATRTNEAAAGQ